MSLLDSFNLIDVPLGNLHRLPGVLLVNSNKENFGFMLKSWGLPILQPKTPQSLSAMSTLLNSESALDEESHLINELVGYVVESNKQWATQNQNTFFLSVSFDKNLTKNFALLFSGEIKNQILEPVEISFSFVGQEFLCNRAHTNSLFKKLESSIHNISCFELRFGSSIENPKPVEYPIERVFEETLIFAHLAITKMI